MGRKRKVARPQDCESRALLPPCRVCEGPAGGFHYGVNSCEACKGFFHRCTRGKEKLYCNADGKCPVLYTMQKICKMCRYYKCITVGMAKQAIKIGRYTARKRDNDALELRNLEEKKSRSEESPREIASRKTISGLHDSLERIQQTEKADEHAHHSQDSNSEHPAIHGPSMTTTWRHCSQKNYMSCSPVSRYSLSPPSQAVHGPSCAGDNSSESRSSPHSPTLFSGTPGYMVNAHNHPCNTSYDRALSQSRYSQNIRELYSDLDGVIEKLLKARKDYVEDLLPSKTDEEMERKADEHLETCRINQEMFGSLRHMPDQDYDNIYATTGLDADGRMQRLATFTTQMELIIRAYTKFAKKVPGFRCLDMADQVNLIKCSTLEFVHFMRANTVTRGVIQYSDLQLRCIRCIGHEKLKDMSRLYIIYCDSMKELEITVEERVLMTAIALVAPDREHIVMSEKANLLYELLNECLIKLFSRRSARPLQMYAKITNIMVGYRTLHHAAANFLKSLRLDKYSNILDNPLLREVFGGLVFEDLESAQTGMCDYDIPILKTS